MTPQSSTPSLILLATASGLGTLACGSADELGRDASRDEVTETIIDNLLAADFPQSEIEVGDDGRVIVGGDAVVSLGASYELAGTPMDGFRHYHTDNLVTVEDICIDGSRFGGLLGAALDAAIANFNRLELSFTMHRTGGAAAGCDATITAFTQGGAGGSAGFPEAGMPFSEISIGVDTAALGPAVLTHVITHELGHCVGFRHTDFYDRSISCNEEGNEGQGEHGANHIPNTPEDAVLDGSVMNACAHPGSTGEWTPADIDALNELYGVSFCEIFDGATVALRTAHGHYLRAGDGGEDWAVDQGSSTGPWEELTVECRDEQAALRTAHGRYLRAGDGGEDWAVDQGSSTGPWELLTPTRQSDGSWVFGTFHGRYLRAGDGGDGWAIDQQSFIGPWEHFEVIRL